MLDLVQKMTGCSAHAAKRAWERLVADNPIMFAKMTADIVKSQANPDNSTFFYESIDAALTARHDRFGAPTCYVYPEDKQPSGTARDRHPLTIFSVDVTHRGNTRRYFMLACDMASLGVAYEVWIVNVVAPMCPDDIMNHAIHGRTGYWHGCDDFIGDYYMDTQYGPVEWYDENYQYHITEKDGRVGPNVYHFRKYYD